MEKCCPIYVECLEDNTYNVECLEDSSYDVNTSTKDYLYVRELGYDWLEYSVGDWEQVADSYRLIIPISAHKCSEPYLDSMVIKQTGSTNKYSPNIPVWHALTNDSIVVTSDEPLDCKIMIKGVFR